VDFLGRAIRIKLLLLSLLIGALLFSPVVKSGWKDFCVKMQKLNIPIVKYYIAK
jgi:hypothetical protein